MSRSGRKLAGARGAIASIFLASLVSGGVGTLVGQLSSTADDAPAVAGVSVQSTDVIPGLPVSGLPILDTEPIRPLPVVEMPQASTTRAAIAKEIVPGATLATAIVAEGVVDVFGGPSEADLVWSMTVPTEFGGPRHFLVVGESGDWLKVQVPVRPNGSTGWIKRSEVSLSAVAHRVEVDLSDRSIVVWDGDDVVLDAIGAVGRDSSPTPLGSFYIRDIFEWNPDSVYGPWVLALSSFSETIDQINGGDAVVAIHGTSAPWDLGRAVSLGCIRLDNDTVSDLARIVGPGTPITVVA